MSHGTIISAIQQNKQNLAQRRTKNLYNNKYFEYSNKSGHAFEFKEMSSAEIRASKERIRRQFAREHITSFVLFLVATAFFFGFIYWFSWLLT